jgi:aspartyl/asparaginyl-tRNA synthetase
MAGVYERVFEINPTYRAEPSATTRHMSEFIHIDVEMCFVDFDQLLQTAEGLLKAIVEHVCKSCQPQLKTWNVQKPKLADKLPRLTLSEVHELYEKETKDVVEDKRDLTPAEERWVCEYAKKKHGSEAVFVTEWPQYDMKFYHKTKDDDPKTAERADLLFRGVEIATITMREHRYDRLLKQLKDKTGANANEPGFKYYLQAFQYGMPPHGGFGWGLERTVEKILNLNNVKEATLFPRDMNRLAP